MITGSDFTTGWIDSAIPTVLAGASEALNGYNFMLVTTIDSTDMRQTTTGRGLARREQRCTFLEDGLVVLKPLMTDESLWRQLFNGFDEVWLFEEPPMLARPQGLSIVGPRRLDAGAVPPGLQEWMRTAGCGVGLGDGDGLNYATSDERFRRALAALDQRLWP